MITFKTKNVDDEILNWEFDCIEEILKEWWANDGWNLPDGDDEVIGSKFVIDNDEICAVSFYDIITELSITYWSKIRI